LKHLRTFIGFVILGVVFLLPEFFLPQTIEATIGEGLEIVAGQPLNIKAEYLEYFADDNLVVAEGSVEITYRKSCLRADWVTFNELTGEATAIGNVIYEEEGETLIADQAELNFDSELGIVHIGEIALENDHYITGQKIEKIGEETYIIRKGTYTACRSCRSLSSDSPCRGSSPDRPCSDSSPGNDSSPAWEFRSTRSKVQQGEYLQAWNTVGYVKGIPVFYFPYFVFPIKTERQTGFLVPDIGKSTSKGFTIGNAFFWAISESQDATLRHTYYEKRGHRVELEYRYKYSNQAEGQFEGQFIRDNIDLSERKRLKWDHWHGLPYAIIARVKLNLTSDDRFDEDFETTLEDQTKRKLQSNVSFTKNFSQHTIRLLFDRLDDLYEKNSEQAKQRFPELHITSQRQQLFGSPLYFEQKTQISHLKEEGKDEKEFDRIDIQPTLSIPLNLGQALTINPALQLRETYYTRDAETASDHDLDAKSIHREYYKASVNVNGPKLNRIFDLGKTRRIQKLKHLIEPNLSFHYAPGIDEEDLPKFDSIDRVGSKRRSRSIAYGITQRLLAKRVKESDWGKFLDDDEDVFADELSTENKELASFSMSQSYNFEADEYNFSNINATLNTQPFNNYKLKLYTGYDVYMNTFVRTDIDLSGKLWNFLNFGVSWRRKLSVKRETDDITDVNQFLIVDTRLNLLGRVGVSYRGRFNVEDSERMEDNIRFTYNAQCWNVIGNYWQRLVGDNRDNGFRVTLELKHLGKLFDIKAN